MISKMEIWNFLSIEHLELKNINGGIIGINGSYKGAADYSNGSGKSALVEAICCALTSQHRYKTDYEMIRLGQDKARICLELEGDYGKLQIDRNWKKRSGDIKGTLSSLKVSLNDEIKSSSSITAGTKYLNEFLGITERDFVYSFYFRQQEYQKLLRDKPADRIKFLQEFFNANIFDTAKKIASSERTEFQKQLVAIKEKIGYLQSEKNTKDEEFLRKSVEEKKDKLKKVKKEKVECNQRIEDLIAEAAACMKRLVEQDFEQKKRLNINEMLKEGKEALLSFTNKIEEKNKSIKLLLQQKKDCKKDATRLEENISKRGKDEEKELLVLKEQHAKIVLDISSAALDRKNKEAELLEVKKDNCPVCVRPISSELRAKLEKEKTKLLIELADKVKHFSQEKNSVEANIKILQKLEQHNNTYEKELNKVNSVLEKTQNELSKEQEMLALYEDKKLREDKKLEKLLKEKAGLKKDIEQTDIEKETADCKELQNKERKFLEEVEDRIIYWNKHLALSKQALLDCENIKKEIKEFESEKKLIAKEISDRILLEEIFEKCRIDIIRTGLEEVEKTANEIIIEIGATAKEITFDTFKENQKREFSDSLEIYLEDGKGKRNVSGLSGGEFDLASFSIRTALSKYKLMRMNSKIDFMMLDEIFSALDEPSQEEVVSMINYFKEDFSQVFCISHTDLKKVFKNNISVEMSKNGITKLKGVTWDNEK